MSLHFRFWHVTPAYVSWWRNRFQHLLFGWTTSGCPGNIARTKWEGKSNEGEDSKWGLTRISLTDGACVRKTWLLLITVSHLFLLWVIKKVLQSSPQGTGAASTCSPREVCVVQTTQLNWWEDVLSGRYGDMWWKENLRMSRVTFDILCRELHTHIERQTTYQR